MNQPTLQQMLFKNHPPLPTPSKIHKHYVGGKPFGKGYANPVKPNSIATRLVELLKGHKWWSVVELAEHLNAKVPTVHTALDRHKREHKIQSIDGSNGRCKIKYFRIMQNGYGQLPVSGEAV